MKQMAALPWEMAAGGLILLFGISILFAEKSDIRKKTEEIASQVQLQETVSENDMRMDDIISRPAPEMMVKEGTYKTGDEIELWSDIKVKTAEMETWMPAARSKDVLLELLEIDNENVSNPKGGIFAGTMQEAVEIGEAVCYIPESGTLCFFQSGSYVLKIKLTDSLGRYTVKQIVIPVEAG